MPQQRALQPLWRLITIFALVVPLIGLTVAPSPTTALAAPLTTQDLTQGKTAQADFATSLVGPGVTNSNVTYTGETTPSRRRIQQRRCRRLREQRAILSAGKVDLAVANDASWTAAYSHSLQ